MGRLLGLWLRHDRGQVASERRIAVDDCLTVLRSAAVHGTEFATALVLSTSDLRELVPGSMAGGIQINPGHQAVPGLTVEPHAMVPLLQHLNQTRCICVKLHWGQKMEIALQASDADLFAQGDVARREKPGVFPSQFFHWRIFKTNQLRIPVLVGPDDVLLAT